MIDVGVGGGGRRSGLIGHSLMVTCRPSWLRGDSLARTMRPASSNQSFVRGIRRSVGWKAFKEYVGGALWVMPSIAALIALAAGYGLSQIDVPPGSRLDWLAFQGTADDARALLISISSTVVTVIALVLGLTVVALQLSSTQFSPRLLRNFLRDRPTQVVLSGSSPPSSTAQGVCLPSGWKRVLELRSTRDSPLAWRSFCSSSASAW